ncbi:MAG TPA: tetratricopeptide repeat protein [bacterium]
MNLVLLTRPEHPQAHTMKGSIYYAMGNYALANDEWEKVLQLDPSNQEVRQFLDFLKSRKGAPQPPLPGAPKGAPQPNAPQAPRAGGTQGNNPGSQAPGQR